MRFALLDVLTVGGAPRAAEREVLPAPVAAPPDGRVEPEALAAIAGEFRHLREQEQSLLRRQAESLETVAEALSRLAGGREAPVATPAEHEELEALRQAHRRDAAELEALRQAESGRAEELEALTTARARDKEALEAARAELAETRARADRATRRLESTQVKLRRAREELAAEKAPWWRRRRARSALG